MRHFIKSWHKPQIWLRTNAPNLRSGSVQMHQSQIWLRTNAPISDLAPYKCTKIADFLKKEKETKGFFLFLFQNLNRKRKRKKSVRLFRLPPKSHPSKTKPTAMSKPTLHIPYWNASLRKTFSGKEKSSFKPGRPGTSLTAQYERELHCPMMARVKI